MSLDDLRSEYIRPPLRTRLVAKFRLVRCRLRHWWYNSSLFWLGYGFGLVTGAAIMAILGLAGR